MKRSSVAHALSDLELSTSALQDLYVLPSSQVEQVQKSIDQLTSGQVSPTTKDASGGWTLVEIRTAEGAEIGNIDFGTGPRGGDADRGPLVIVLRSKGASRPGAFVIERVLRGSLEDIEERLEGE